MTVGYTVASEGARVIPSKSLRPAQESVRIPAGKSHALAPGATTTVCGLPSAAFKPFPDIAWAGGPSLTRCRDCQRLTQTT